MLPSGLKAGRNMPQYPTCPVLEHCDCILTQRGSITKCKNIAQARLLDEDFRKLQGAKNTKIAFADVNISDLPSKWFSNLSVTVLDIKHCPLREITQAVASSIKNLSTLIIENGQLQSVPRGLAVLAQLRVCKNPIKFLQGVLAMPELGILDLSSNEIEEVDEDYFSKSPKLRLLMLFDNKIRRLPANVFKKTKNIKIINLRKNNIGTIGSQFRHLGSLEVSYVYEF
ncbi:hypothetical protein MTO96_034772 [Rhipicephalus appendiculatus]